MNTNLAAQHFEVIRDNLLKAEREYNAALQTEIKVLKTQAELDKPKILFADCIMACDNSILIRDLAKILRQNGCKTNEQKLLADLHKHGFLMQCGTHKNIPTQQSFDLGLMETVEYTTYNKDGKYNIRLTPRITGKGQVYFINMFLNQEVNSCAQN